MVMKIGDVDEADIDKLEPAPANMRGIQGEFFKGVYKTENTLIVILDIDKVLSLEE